MVDKFKEAVDLIKRMSKMSNVYFCGASLPDKILKPPNGLFYKNYDVNKLEENRKVLDDILPTLFGDQTIEIVFNCGKKVKLESGEMFYVETKNTDNWIKTMKGCKFEIDDINEYEKNASKIYEIFKELKDEEYIEEITNIPHNPQKEEYIQDDRIVKAEYIEQYNKWKEDCKIIYEAFNVWEQHVNEKVPYNEIRVFDYKNIDEIYKYLITDTLQGNNRYSVNYVYPRDEIFRYEPYYDYSGKLIGYKARYDERDFLYNNLPRPENEWFEKKIGISEVIDENYVVKIKCNTEFCTELIKQRIINYRSSTCMILKMIERQHSDYEWK